MRVNGYKKEPTSCVERLSDNDGASVYIWKGFRMRGSKLRWKGGLPLKERLLWQV